MRGPSASGTITRPVQSNLEEPEMALVGIIADRFAADGEIVSGGAERHTYQLARLASESGAEVIVYQASHLTAEANISGLRVRSLKAKPSTIWQVATRQAM